MRKRGGFFSLFVIFFLLSLISFLLFRGHDTQPGGVIAWMVSSLRSNAYAASIRLSDTNSTERAKQLQETTKQVVGETMNKENAALRDQFQTSSPRSSILLPSHILAAKGFIPGVSDPESFTIDVGSSDGVKSGYAVVLKDNLVGIITRVSSKLSIVQIVGNKQTSFTGKTLQTNAQGIIKGQGSGKMLFTNVVLSEKLNRGDVVITKGDMDISGTGVPANLIIGKIVSVDKKPSSLFQSAQVQSVIDMRHIDMVFVVMKIE